MGRPAVKIFYEVPVNVKGAEGGDDSLLHQERIELFGNEQAANPECGVAANLIRSLGLNIRYDNGKVTCITGSDDSLLHQERIELFGNEQGIHNVFGAFYFPLVKILVIFLLIPVTHDQCQRYDLKPLIFFELLRKLTDYNSICWKLQVFVKSPFQTMCYVIL